MSITISTLDDPSAIVPKSHSYPELAPKWLIVKAEAPKEGEVLRKEQGEDGSRLGGRVSREP